MLTLNVIPNITDNDIMTIEDLKNINYYRSCINNTKSVLDNIDYNFLRSSTPSQERISSSAKRSVLEDKTIKLMEQKEQLELYIAEKTEELQCLLLKATSIINKIRNASQREILIYRYIDGMKWGEILDKRECLSEGAQYDLHQRALASFMSVQE